MDRAPSGVNKGKLRENAATLCRLPVKTRKPVVAFPRFYWEKMQSTGKYSKKSGYQLD
jgi:hypothetical protein